MVATTNYNQFHFESYILPTCLTKMGYPIGKNTKSKMFMKVAIPTTKFIGEYVFNRLESAFFHKIDVPPNTLKAKMGL